VKRIVLLMVALMMLSKTTVASQLPDVTTPERNPVFDEVVTLGTYNTVPFNQMLNDLAEAHGFRIAIVCDDQVRDQLMKSTGNTPTMPLGKLLIALAAKVRAAVAFEGDTATIQCQGSRRPATVTPTRHHEPVGIHPPEHPRLPERTPQYRTREQIEPLVDVVGSPSPLNSAYYTEHYYGKGGYLGTRIGTGDLYGRGYYPGGYSNRYYRDYNLWYARQERRFIGEEQVAGFMIHGPESFLSKVRVYVNGCIKTVGSEANNPKFGDSRIPLKPGMVSTVTFVTVIDGEKVGLNFQVNPESMALYETVNEGGRKYFKLPLSKETFEGNTSVFPADERGFVCNP
jgi:hypothetical protein